METAKREVTAETEPATRTGAPEPAPDDGRGRLVDLDTQIIDLVRRRAAEQRRFVAARRAVGRPATDLAWENAVVLRYGEELRRPGVRLALLLLEMGRG
ncbi:hypothetical protein [Streptomyces sp. NPDC056632]|uniref:hypothetical protein n=1 Tax=unclassified Streptomyces TaxID=2593676 RepID=UPI00367600C5